MKELNEEKNEFARWWVLITTLVLMSVFAYYYVLPKYLRMERQSVENSQQYFNTQVTAINADIMQFVKLGDNDKVQKKYLVQDINLKYTMIKDTQDVPKNITDFIKEHKNEN